MVIYEKRWTLRPESTVSNIIALLCVAVGSLVLSKGFKREKMYYSKLNMSGVFCDGPVYSKVIINCIYFYSVGSIYTYHTVSSPKK